MYLLLSLLCQRDLEDKRTAGQFLFIVARAFDPDLASVRFDNACRNCQTKPGPPPLNLVRPEECSSTFPKLVELFEDDLVVGRINADAGIADADLTKLTMSIHLDRLGIDKDRTAIGCEFNGIDNDIVESLFQEF